MGWGRLLEQLYNVFVYDKTAGIIIGASLINDTAERDLRNADREKMFFRIISRSVFFFKLGNFFKQKFGAVFSPLLFIDFANFNRQGFDYL
jgi:hypothetical protein